MCVHIWMIYWDWIDQNVARFPHLAFGFHQTWCQTLISFGGVVRYDIWFLLVELRYWVPIIVWSKESLSVLIKKTKGYQGSEQKGFFIFIFLDPSSPRLASGSPRSWNSFMPKQPTHLGELIPLELSNQLAWASSTTPKWLFPNK